MQWEVISLASEHGMYGKKKKKLTKTEVQVSLQTRQKVLLPVHRCFALLSQALSSSFRSLHRWSVGILSTFTLLSGLEETCSQSASRVAMSTVMLFYFKDLSAFGNNVFLVLTSPLLTRSHT